MIEEFDPNKPQDNPNHVWGTFAPTNYGKNRGKWKTHEKLQHVRSAIDWNRPITVYKLIDDRWEEVLHVDGPHVKSGIPITNPDTCYVCNQSVKNPKDLFSWIETAWSPDADFEKIKVHYQCRRKLKPRKG